MRLRRIADILLGAGFVLGVGAVVGYQLDLIPTLSPALLKLLFFKVALGGSAGLLGVGAVARRIARRSSDASAAALPAGAGADLEALPEPQGKRSR